MIASATEAKARIFDIQGFSLKDGPGIRTTVFFMGCPLRCRWCHNPESFSLLPRIMFHSNLCVGCMKCVEACKYGAHGAVMRNGSLVHVVDNGKCVGCGECLKVCCYDALTLPGREYTPASLLAQVEKDFRYFRLKDADGKSSGGITFSGGEPLLHADFIAEFCALIPDVHTAIETSGYAEQGEIEKLLDCVDLFLYDFKLADPRKHEEWCGVDNARILENLDFLYGKGKRIILRLPMIQGVNDTKDHFDGIVALLEKYPGIERAEILPYHTFGIGKMEQLGLEADPALPSADATRENVAGWLEELASRGRANVFSS